MAGCAPCGYVVLWSWFVDGTLLVTQTFYGTPLYASPELCDNLPYNEKTDIWSLGVVLYELAALTPPFNGAC